MSTTTAIKTANGTLKRARRIASILMTIPLHLQALLMDVALIAMTCGIVGPAGADPLLQVAPLEPERIQPSLTAHVPVFPLEPEAARWIIFNNHIAPGHQPEALFLRVPREFAGSDPGEPVRAWGINLLVHYPDMTGPRNPQNRGKLGVCAGGCPGEMMISIYNDIGSIAFGPELSFANLESDRRNPAFALTRYTDVPSDKFTMIVSEEHGTDPKNVSDTLYFIQKRIDGSVQFFARCTYNTIVHLCVAYAASTKVPGVEVQYNLHLEDIDDWARIQSTVLEFADRLIVGAFGYVGTEQ